MASLRGRTTAWNNATTGVNGKSSPAVVGAQNEIAVYVTVSGTTTITIECSPGPASGTMSAGINAAAGLATTDWYTMQKRDGSADLSISFTGAGSKCLDLTPFAPQYIRLSSSNSVTATAFFTVNGAN